MGTNAGRDFNGQDAGDFQECLFSIERDAFLNFPVIQKMSCDLQPSRIQFEILEANSRT